MKPDRSWVQSIFPLTVDTQKRFPKLSICSLTLLTSQLYKSILYFSPLPFSSYSPPFLLLLPSLSFPILGSCHLVFYRMYGGPLLKHIQQRKTFTEREAGEVIKEVTEALNFLHGRGVAHRDLKPENILCEKKDQVGFVGGRGGAWGLFSRAG